MNTTKRLLAVAISPIPIALVLLACAALAADGPRLPQKWGDEKGEREDPVVGLWTIAGMTPGIKGSEYTGTVQIIKTGDGYAVLISAVMTKTQGFGWTQVKAVGLLEGDSLSVSYVTEDHVGLSVWTLSKDKKRMSGRWSYFPGNKAGVESLKFIGKPADPPGET